MVYDQHMLETILTQLRHELLTRAPLDTLPPGVWRRTGALNTWGTNAIEGNTLTRKDVERILLEGRSVSNRSLPDVLETIQHEQAFESLLRRRTDAIRLSSVLDLHDTVFRGIKPDAGQWRQVNVRIAGVRHVPPRMEKVVALMSDWEESYAKQEMEGVDVFSLGARMHFEFESIHPFSDGNGRVGRLLLNLHFLKHNWPPVHILPRDRSRYLRSLNAGHTGDLTGLEAFLTSAMGRSLLDLLDQVGTAGQTRRRSVGTERSPPQRRVRSYDDTDELRDSLRRAPAGSHGTTSAPRHRCVSDGPTPAPPLLWRRGRPRRGRRDQRFRRQSPPCDADRGRGHPVARRHWSRGRNHRVARGSERAPHPADSLAERRSAGDPDPGGRSRPASPSRSVPRCPPRFEAAPHPEARRSGRLLVPVVLAQTHREAGEGSPRGVRSRLLRIPAEGDNGTGQSFSRHRSEHIRTASEPGRAPCCSCDAPDGPRAFRPRRRGSVGGLLEVQSRTRTVRPARGPGGSRRRGEAGSQSSVGDGGIRAPVSGTDH